MGITGLIIGIITFIGFLIGFIPLLGWFNWFNIPFAVLGLVLSIISTATSDNYKGPAITGITLNAVAIIFGGMRLAAGGGIL
jgi:hypothetical protein